MALLEVNGIDVFYGAIQALRSLSIHVEEGERVALLGANGAGKTTTLRSISALVHPAKGDIKLRGRPIHGLSAYQVVGRGVAHVPEGRDLFAAMSVMDNLRLGYWARRKDKGSFDAQLERMFTYFPRLKERRNQAAGTLSGGEQQMLVLSRGLMSSPELLIVDELSLGLAPMIVAQLFEILAEVNKDGTAVVIVEQFVHMALDNTDRAYVLAKGEVALEGRSKDLRNDPGLIASYLGESAEPEVATKRNT